MKGWGKKCTIAAVLVLCFVTAGFVAPGPIEGFWDPVVTRCMCDSKNLVEFRDGKGYMSSDHPDIRGECGHYYREKGAWIWESHQHNRTTKTKLYPTWFLLRIESDYLEEPVTGYRILWPPTLSDARAKLKP